MVTSCGTCNDIFYDIIIIIIIIIIQLDETFVVNVFYVNLSFKNCQVFVFYGTRIFITV